MTIDAEEKEQAFDLMVKLGMTIENRRFHACAQIGHVHYGYVRYKDCYSEVEALWLAINQCADSYYRNHPEERQNGN